MNKTKRNAYAGILIALSFVGSMIKIQNSIAFDSMPAFLGALVISPGIGAVIGFIGHIITAAMSGFYLTVPMHIIIALEMFAFTYIFGKLYRVNRILGSAVLIFLNSAGSAVIAAFATSLFGLPLSGMKMFAAVILPLFLGSLANTVLAVVVYEGLYRSGKTEKI